MKLKNLKGNDKNPRKITEGARNRLKKSLDKFGDLSGVVYNRRSKQLVSGHQRSALLADAKVVVEKTYEAPTRAGTVAEGYVDVGGERHKYREVDWDVKTETEALLAANNHGGQWDQDLLRVLKADVPDMDLEVAGFDVPAPVHIAVPAPSFAEDEESDEAYAARTSGTGEERVATVAEELNAGSPPMGGNVFAEVRENTEIPGKRIIIIINCETEEMKQELREELRAQVEAKGAKFF